MSSMQRNICRTAGGLLLALAGLLSGASSSESAPVHKPGPTPSASATAERAWTFAHLKDNAWTKAPTGPYSVVPSEGAVDGWRYAATETETPRMPRAMPSFDDICSKVVAEAGKKRIGVVIDYGRKADGAEGANPPAPISRCAQVPSGASSSEVLTAVAMPRDASGRVCSIDNYPGGNVCGEPLTAVPEEAKAADERVGIAVSAPREQPKPQDAATVHGETAQSPSKTILTGVAVVVVGTGFGVFYLMKKRREKKSADDLPAVP
ncbi:hypothetical protein SAMN05421595_1067 [Austwickia chelonae]|uniref:Secreted protein n=2 Tax=Austwickia TaxID=1184606 RepID=K6VPF1_9MICO|nr:hypothetical protein AUCHE_05_01550 [Austwickia chelonae NBRC 105200]SEW06159.1 hypothetical protein SAMN05421595_1067 [Austwickia chelonae]